MATATKVGALLFISAAVSLGGQTLPARQAPAQTGVTGTWQSESFRGWTLVITGDRPQLTGAVSGCANSPNTEIFDGRVDGKTVTFKCRSADGDRLMTFVGTINGDVITFTWDLQRARRWEAPWPFR